MSFTIRKFYEEPIILGTALDSFDLTIDLYACLYATCTQLEAVEEPVYLIGNVHNLKPSFGDILNGFALASQGNVAILQHPALLEMVIISPSSFLNTSVHKLHAAQAALAKVHIQPTLEAGLAYVRSQIKKGQNLDRLPPSTNGYRFNGGRIGTGRLDAPSGQPL